MFRWFQLDWDEMETAKAGDLTHFLSQHSAIRVIIFHRMEDD